MSNSPASGCPASTIDINQHLDTVTAISTLPEVTARIVSLVQDPQARARDLRAIIECDAALASRVLRVVNSAFYGMPAQVASLERAIPLLGLNAVKNIALAASMSRMFNARDLIDRYFARKLWQHSVATAVRGRLLASATTHAPADEVFVAGLVHDIGLIVEQQLFPNLFGRVVEECCGDPLDCCAIEDRLIGINHQVIGEALAARWKFPASLRHAIRHHHQPDSPGLTPQPTTVLVHIADVLDGGRPFGCTSGQAPMVIDQELASVGLSKEQLDQLLQNATSAIAEAEAIFGDGG